MKKFLYLLIGVIAIACSRETLAPENMEDQNSMFPNNVKMYEISLGVKNMDGDLTVNTEPLSKADDESNDLWWFQIYYKPETGGSLTPYAYGVFEQKENMTVRLAEGYVYNIYANWIKDGKDKIYKGEDGLWRAPVWGAIGIGAEETVGTTNTFVISSDQVVGTSDSETYIWERSSPDDRLVTEWNGTTYKNDTLGYRTDYPMIDRYYGVVKDYVPVEGGKVAINMYRMQTGYRIETLPFESGELVVDFLNWCDTIPANTEITTIARDLQYSSSWGTIETYGMDTTANGRDQINNMSYTPSLEVVWLGDDGQKIVIYKDYVELYRLKRSVIRITLKQVDAHENAIEFATEDVEVMDGETLEIEGNINDGEDVEITPGA